jgi:uncharacterized membrane protein
MKSTSSVTQRLQSIDQLRGGIMCLMALDHTRDYFSAAHFNPLDLDQTTVGLFLTRWITHFCAPLFILLSGISTSLSLTKDGNPCMQSRLLMVRGLLLIVLELTWIRVLGWDFGLDPDRISVGVIWAIGWSMVILSILIHVPRLWILLFSLIVIIGHNAFDGYMPDAEGGLRSLWIILHAGGQIPLWGNQHFHPYYPLMPWPAVMALGFVMGPLFQAESRYRQRLLFQLGLLMTLCFLVLRGLHGYGDNHGWSIQSDLVRTIFSFIDCTKYPPSLHYLLMTVGPGLVILSLIDRYVAKQHSWLTLYGEVPLFFYLLHLPLIHGLAALIDLWVYGNAIWQFQWPINPSLIKPPIGHGYNLLGVYAVTFFVLLLLYPLCRSYAALKRARTHAITRYI